MREQLANSTISADKESWQRLGSLPMCLALGCCDIGIATVNGERVFTTWGRNLDLKTQQWFADHTGLQTIHLGSDDGSSEIILPAEQIKPLLAAIVW